MIKQIEPQEFIEPMVELAITAGEAILKVYATDFGIQEKNDGSPLTQADMASHHRIYQGLKALTPDIPILSEESELPTFAERSQWERYWLVDPLDGTREFVNRNGEFTINIALIEASRPIFGVVYVPVINKIYFGCANYGAECRSDGADWEKISVSKKSAEPVRIVGSRSHRGSSLDEFLEKLGAYEMCPMGSSLKFCLIAEGAADIYPRFGPTSEWDTAAAQAVVEQAGGSVVTLDGNPLLYNRKSDIINAHFLVIGGKDRDWLGMV
jgi:3'(2'), 5'-bisphosphate nucleotidase